MPNREPHDFPVDPYVVNGGVLAERLTRLVESLDTRESGYARPSYAQRGTIWLDESNIIGSPSTVKMMVFDGAHDVLLHEVNVDSGEVIGGGGVGGRAWDDLTQYKTGDVVTEATSLYIAIQDSTGSAPSTHPVDWLLFDLPDYDGVVPYADIAALRYAPTGVGSVVYLSQDGRAGHFKWSSANHAADVTADTQSGIYVAPNSDLTGASGAWVRQYDGAVNVKWFGAAGDGIVDDTVAIQAAVDYGVKVFLPNGDYVVSRSIYVKNSTYITGESRSNTVIKPTINWPEVIDGKNNRGVFNVFLVDWFGFYNLRFDTHLQSGTDEVNFICIDSSYTQAGVLNDDTGSADFTTETKNFEISGCHFHKCSDAALNISGNYAHNGIDVKPWTHSFTVANNIFEEALDEGGQLMEVQAGAGRGAIIGNEFIGPFSKRSAVNTVRYALRLQSAQDLVISGNRFFDWDGLDGTYTAGVSDRWCGAGIHCQRSGWGVRRVTITGNVFHKVGCGVSLRQGSADINITGNVFTHVYMSVLYFNAGEDFVGDLPANNRDITGIFSGNTVTGWGYIPNNAYKYCVYNETGYIKSFSIDANIFNGQSEVGQSMLYQTVIETAAGDAVNFTFTSNAVSNVLGSDGLGIPTLAFRPSANSTQTRGTPDVSVQDGVFKRMDLLALYLPPMSDIHPVIFSMRISMTDMAAGDEVVVNLGNFNNSVVYASATFIADSAEGAFIYDSPVLVKSLGDVIDVWVKLSGSASATVRLSKSNVTILESTNTFLP